MNLSASRIKTAKTCGLEYWYKYHEKIETLAHPKTRCGSVVHYLLENLSRQDRREKVKKIIETSSLQSYPAAYRYSKILKNKFDIPDFWPEEIEKLVLVGLSYNFWGDDYQKPIKTYIELPFEIKTKDYSVQGFLDKVFIYEKNGEKFGHIVDYKTSKDIFSGTDEYDNIQAHIYSWVLTEKLGVPIKNVKVTFLFLRHKNSCNFAFEVKSLSEERLTGILEELSYWQKYLEGLTFDEAKSLSAAKKDYDPKIYMKGPNLCGKLWRTYKDGKPKKDSNGSLLDDSFSCCFRLPRVYWREIDSSGKSVKTWLDKPKDIPQDHSIEKYVHKGCQYWENHDRKKIQENFDSLTPKLLSAFELYES